MTSARVVARAVVLAAIVLVAAGAARADTHAPWPTDWNNWNDPALWVTVGNPGNTGQWVGSSYRGDGPDRLCGAVGYTFSMGKFEVTAGQYTAFLNAVAKTDTYGLYHFMYVSMAEACGIYQTGSSGSYTYNVASDWANRPASLVTWGDAARFANWITNGQPKGDQDHTTTESGTYYLNGANTSETLAAVTRIADSSRVPGKKYYCIPTEDEWYKAAYHRNDGVTGNYWHYPASMDSVPTNQLINPDPGDTATFRDDNGDPTIAYPGSTTEVGDHENSHSPYGTFDQGGNVSEWTETLLYSGPFQQDFCVRGGYWDHGINMLQASSQDAEYPTADTPYYGVGFRISEVPEPATLALLAAGAAALVMRRRRH